MAPQNVAYETERLIATALYHRRPAYMAFPVDLANEPVVSRAQPLDLPFSNRPALDAAVDAIGEALDGADTACILPGILAARAGLRERVQSSLLPGGSGRSGSAVPGGQTDRRLVILLSCQSSRELT
jgi:indolepyruvate decarboxylase